MPIRISAPRKQAPRTKKLPAVVPQILIFDVDGVLVDVRGTYWRSALETVRYFTGKRVTYAELHKWKSQPGFNDDWSMVSAWVSSLGKPVSYDQARSAFEKFYWGSDGKPGNVRNEKILVTPHQVEKWAQRFELNLFTGRTRQEFSFSFERWPATRYFQTIVTMDDAPKKPDPEGLLRILGGRDPATALYLGDNIDDALAAREAAMPFMAILAPGEHHYRQRAARFRELGALRLLRRATELNHWLG
ncbi:MAG TPA: HAD-IA family hydrolase [Candidatus Angelobacter sp.]|nr:HAD-IA family hydrolase [Candidatus Angelobacter sp.]